MKSKTLNQIKWFERLLKINVVYYFIYNTYFGWNYKPINETEKYFDIGSQVLLGIALGILLSAILNFMELVVNYIQSKTK